MFEPINIYTTMMKFEAWFQTSLTIWRKRASQFHPVALIGETWVFDEKDLKCQHSQRFVHELSDSIIHLEITQNNTSVWWDRTMKWESWTTITRNYIGRPYILLWGQPTMSFVTNDPSHTIDHTILKKILVRVQTIALPFELAESASRYSTLQTHDDKHSSPAPLCEA